MTEEINRTRRGFLGTTAATAAIFNLGGTSAAYAQVDARQPLRKLEPIKQIDAGLLNVGYYETGPARGDPVKLDGMGMGLSICRSIVEAHQGRLWFMPNKPWGTEFRFTLSVGVDAVPMGR